MAVKQTPHGREIGLFAEDEQPKPDTKAADLTAEGPQESPKRPGRPKKTQ